MAAHKFLKLDTNGRTAEEAAVATSAGSGDDGKVVALNSSGILDSTIVNSKTSSAGSGDSGKIPALDGSGKLDTSFLPTGVGADVKILPATETLAAGDFVNVWSSSGTPSVRKADATSSGKEADGFVLSAVTSGANATVYMEGTNNQLTGLTGGTRYFLATSAGSTTASALTGSGNVVQYLGKALSSTEISFEPDEGVIRA